MYNVIFKGDEQVYRWIEMRVIVISMLYKSYKLFLRKFTELNKYKLILLNIYV